MNKPPDLGTAYVLLVLGGFLGLHRFYIGSRKVGTYMALTPLAVGALTLIGFAAIHAGQGRASTIPFLLASAWIVSIAAICYLDIFRLEDLIEELTEEELPLRRERNYP